MALIKLSGAYVKVNSNNELLVYPYTESSLREENPHTKYNFARHTLFEWYYLTEDHLDNNNEIKEVYIHNSAVCEGNTKFSRNSEPTFDETEDKWVLGFTCVPMSEEEIENKNIFESTRPTTTDET